MMNTKKTRSISNYCESFSSLYINYSSIRNSLRNKKFHFFTNFDIFTLTQTIPRNTNTIMKANTKKAQPTIPSIVEIFFISTLNAFRLFTPIRS